MQGSIRGKIEWHNPLTFLLFVFIRKIFMRFSFEEPARCCLLQVMQTRDVLSVRRKK